MKGIHDSSSDMDLVLGYNMEIRIHAPEGYDGRKYYDTAKGLMINTVELASFNSIPEYNQRIRLQDGAIINARLTHGRQVVDVYPVIVDEEELGTSSGLFIFQFLNLDQPKVLIYEDEDSPDGISLMWADNLHNGAFTSQSPDIEADKEVQTLSLGQEYVEGFYKTNDFHDGAFSEHGGRYVFVDGVVLINIKSIISTSTLLGACLVQDKMYCFIIKRKVSDTSYFVDLYSHPKVDIDYNAEYNEFFQDPDSITPLVDFFNCALVHSIEIDLHDDSLTSGGATKYALTRATFNESGTKASFAFLGGLIIAPDASSAENAQEFYSASLSTNNDGTIMTVSSSVNPIYSHVVVSELTTIYYDGTQIPDWIVLSETYKKDQVNEFSIGISSNSLGQVNKVLYETHVEQYRAEQYDSPAVPYTNDETATNNIIPYIYDYEFKAQADADYFKTDGNSTGSTKYTRLIQYSINEGIDISVSTDQTFIPTTLVGGVWEETTGCSYSYSLKINNIEIPGLPEFNIGAGPLGISNCSLTNVDSSYLKRTSGDVLGAKSNNSIDAPMFSSFMLTHQKGYALIAPADNFIQRNRTGYVEGTTVITGVCFLYVKSTGKFIDIVNKYNFFLSRQTDIHPLHSQISKQYVEVAANEKLSLLNASSCSVAGKQMPKALSKYGYINN